MNYTCGMCKAEIETEAEFIAHRCPMYVKPYQTPESQAPSAPAPAPTPSGFGKKVDDALAAIDSTLAERGSRYGVFTGHARITQALKDDMRVTPNWTKLQDDQREALDMIQHKIGRILNGDPDYHDSWHDIVGYAKLVADRLLGRPQ